MEFKPSVERLIVLEKVEDEVDEAARAMVGELFGAHAVDAIWDAPRAEPRAAGSNGSPHTDAGGGPGVKRRRDVAGEPPPS